MTLFPLPTLSPPTPLTGAKAAFSFATHTFVEHILPGGKVEELSDVGFTKTKAIPTLVTQLIVGCRRKLVIYSWRDGEAQEAKVRANSPGVTYLTILRRKFRYRIRPELYRS